MADQTAKAQQLHTLKLRLDARGHGQVWLDDIEIGKLTSVINLTADASEGNQVVITLSPAVELDVEVVAGVVVQRPEPSTEPYVEVTPITRENGYREWAANALRNEDA